MEFGDHDRRRLAFRLVDDQRHRPATPPQQRGDLLVAARQAFARIHHEQHDVGFVERPHRLARHQSVQRVLRSGQTAGVHDDVGHRPDAAEAVLPVPCQPG